MVSSSCSYLTHYYIKLLIRKENKTPLTLHLRCVVHKPVKTENVSFFHHRNHRHVFHDKRARGGGCNRHGRLWHGDPPRPPSAEVFSTTPILRSPPNPSFSFSGSAILHIQRWVPPSPVSSRTHIHKK